MKKIIVAILGVVMIGLGSLMVAQPTYAAECSGGEFLGFKAWYNGLTCDSNNNVVLTGECKDGEEGDCSKISADGKEISQFVWRIVLNVLFDLSLAVGYLAVGMVIYGGFMYMTSQGDPTRVMKGKKTLTSAVIGTVIALSASVIVNTLTFVLGITNGRPNEGFDNTSLAGVFNWAYGMAGLIAVVFIIKGGFDYMVATGNPAKLQQATKSIIYAVVGLVVVILAAAITNFVMAGVGGAL